MSAEVVCVPDDVLLGVVPVSCFEVEKQFRKLGELQFFKALGDVAVYLVAGLHVLEHLHTL